MCCKFACYVFNSLKNCSKYRLDFLIMHTEFLTLAKLMRSTEKNLNDTYIGEWVFRVFIRSTDNFKFILKDIFFYSAL